ncbi:MAG: efflux RND transporter periplasmic adaptor subunit [Pirellulaceae bacterium]|nr:efflux RND transporter periplasmic adaptor subunit [Pirellulaceae bacterium]
MNSSNLILEPAAGAVPLTELLHAIVGSIDARYRPQAVYFHHHIADGAHRESTERILPSQPIQGSDPNARIIDAACQVAYRSNAIEARQLASPSRSIVAIPFEIPSIHRQVVGFVFPSDDFASTLILVAKSIVHQIAAWQACQAHDRVNRETQETAAVLEFVERILSSTDLQQACFRLASDLSTYLSDSQVAIGYVGRSSGKCQLVALSQAAIFDKRSPFVMALESIMDLAKQKKASLCWPNASENSKQNSVVEQALCEEFGIQNLMCIPLFDGSGHATSVIVVTNQASETNRVESLRFLTGAAPSWGLALASLKRRESGIASNCKSRTASMLRPRKAQLSLAAATIAIFALFIQSQHTILCPSQIEPIACRFVAAPFEGTLEKSFVKPGDIVESGELLARMDGREIRWKRASVLADQNQAVKKRDAAQATRNYAEQQIAQLEIERLALEIQLLEHRTEYLEIVSPVAGIVASGDLARVEGAPLSIGQTLFEIAPLERMLAEIAIADDQISYAKVGQEAEIRIDAYPGQVWSATVARIQPRSEIRDDANVFIAEVELDNADERLRPGMKGRGRLVAGKRSYGWLFFHEPFEYLSKKLYW